MRKSIASIMWISIVASMLTIGLKWLAYSATDSVGFLSDAMESGINLLAGIVAFYSLTVAARPADKEHPFGHDKAEYFSSLTEGVLIVLAAFGIAYTAINRLYHPQPLQALDYGMLLSVVATIINFITSRVLLYFSKKHNSITIEADAHHLMTDVWTTVGIIAGIFLVKITGWQLLDPIMAILVAISIVYTGVKLIIRSTDGLMDSRLTEKEMVLIREVLDCYKSNEIDYHALYTRRASAKQFITFHLLFPGEYTVFKAHEVTKQIELELKKLLPLADVFIHVEPLNDPDAFDDRL
jgi:cation diffusion facilitator family transporter